MGIAFSMVSLFLSHQYLLIFSTEQYTNYGFAYHYCCLRADHELKAE